VLMVRHGYGLLSPMDYIIFCPAAQPAPGVNPEK